uniref:Ribosome biogenesis protein slx9-like n=1 Tax=Davidia involucrata TaxID=16924 RepID=A0A5B7CAX4_DAVIN
MGKTSSRSEPSTRADLKFEKKLQFYAKVRDTVASLSAQKAISKKKKHKSRQKKLKAYDLSSLTEFLPELKAPQQPTAAEFKLNSKSRQNLVLKEGNQLRTVLNHPAFQSDPLVSIHQHLQSTQPIMNEKPERKKSKSGKKAKRKKPKASPGPQSMEI